MARALRTRFKDEIVAEFLPPARRTKRNRVIIICDGMPSVPAKRDLVDFFSKKGFWAFYPRYRGSWESDGTFLEKSLDRDILDVIDSLPRGFVDLWSGKRYKVRPDVVYLFAGSFGGPAGILASRDKRVKKVVAISPIVDWLAPSKAEPLDFAEKFAHLAFGNGYRFGKKEWAKLSTGKFYSPVYHQYEIDGSKLFIFHAKDDQSVRWNEVAKFARITHSRLKLFKKGGHLRVAKIIEKHWREIARFLK